MNKKQLAKCRPGTWLRIRWDDCQVDDIALLLTKIDRDETGDISVKCFYPMTGDYHRHAIHTQVVESLGHVLYESYDDIRRLLALCS